MKNFTQDSWQSTCFGIFYIKNI